MVMWRPVTATSICCCCCVSVAGGHCQSIIRPFPGDLLLLPGHRRVDRGKTFKGCAFLHPSLYEIIFFRSIFFFFFLVTPHAVTCCFKFYPFAWTRTFLIIFLSSHVVSVDVWMCLPLGARCWGLWGSSGRRLTSIFTHPGALHAVHSLDVGWGEEEGHLVSTRLRFQLF